MVKPSIIFAAAGVAVLVLTNSVAAISGDYAVQGGDVNTVRRQRVLRAAVISSIDDVTNLLDGSLPNGDEEDALRGKGSLGGHTPLFADAGHDNNPPCHHDEHDKAKDNKPKGDKKSDGPHSPANNDDHHQHQHHHDASASMASHDCDGNHTPPAPSKHHVDAKSDGNQPYKGDGKVPGKGASEHQHHNPADVGYSGKAYHHGVDSHALPPTKNGVNKASKSGDLHNTPSEAIGSADAYLTKG